MAKPTVTFDHLAIDRPEHFFNLDHGIRIPIDPSIMTLLAWFDSETEYDHPDSYEGTITQVCISRGYIVRVFYPAEFFILSTRALDEENPWRGEMLLTQDDVIDLCLNFSARVLDEKYQAVIDEREGEQLRKWANASTSSTSDCELIEEPAGLAIRYKEKVAKFDSDERTACKFFFVVLSAFLQDGRRELELSKLREQIGSQASNPRWAYNLCQRINQRTASLGHGFELSCPKGSAVVILRPVTD